MSLNQQARTSLGRRAPARLARASALVFACVPLSCTPSPPATETFADGRVVALRDGPSQVAAYVLTLDDGSLAVIDTGLEPGAPALVELLASRDQTLGDVAAVFVTHGHGDHIGGLDAFDGIPVYGAFADQPLVEGTANPERPLPSFGAPEPTGVSLTEDVVDESPVEVGGTTVTPFLVPGHTDGHVVYLAAGVLFLGDSATANGGGGLDNAIWIFSKDTEENLESLRHLAERLDARGDVVDVLAPSHSGNLEGRDALDALVGL